MMLMKISFKHVWKLPPVLQTALEQQNVAIILMTANSIENPLKSKQSIAEELRHNFLAK